MPLRSPHPLPDRPGAYDLRPSPEDDARAAGWPLELVSRETEPGHHYPAMRGQATVTAAHLICTVDGQTVFCLAPDTARPGYVLTDEMIRAGVLRHLRECHEPQVIPPAPSA